MKRLDDSKLIARIRQGDKALFGILTEKYYDSIYYYCYYKIGQEAAAYDCTQDTFLKLIRFFDAYEDRNKFKSYLFSIATNVCNDYFRKNPNIFVTEKYLEAIPILDIKLQASENKYSIQNALNKNDVNKLIPLYNIGNLKNIGDSTLLRIISKEKPMENAISTTPTLEDIYLYYFSEEVKNGTAY